MKKFLFFPLVLATTAVFAQANNQIMPKAGLSTTINSQQGLPQPMRINPKNVAIKAGANPPPGAKPIAPPSRIPPVGGPPLPKNTPVKTNVEKRLLECSKAPSGEKLSSDEISTCMSKKGFKKSKDQHVKEIKAPTPATTSSSLKPATTSSVKTTNLNTVETVSQYNIQPLQPNFKK